MKILSEKNTEEIAELELELVKFYNTFDSYPAFSQPSNHEALWREILRLIRVVILNRSECRVLEIGAGRSGFGTFLRESCPCNVHLTSQDVTEANADHLKYTSDTVIIGNIDKVHGCWDIIFHAYVYEHLCRPREFNEMLWEILRVNGFLIIQSPRYDFALYPCPCLSHLSVFNRLRFALIFIYEDVKSSFTSQHLFNIFSDPAVFHLPFRRDYDAVHRVRRADIKLLFGKRTILSDFTIPYQGWKDFIVKRFLTLRIIAQKLE